MLALTLHSTGFLGNFYAEDIENADDRPQNYSHVGTILIAIFITVFLLDQLAAAMRRRFA